MRVEADGIHNWQPLFDRLRRMPHVTGASPGLYEQVMVARGARAGYALMEGILPDQEKTVSDLLSTVSPEAIRALQPQATPAVRRELPPIVLARIWRRPSAPASAIALRWSARKAR